MFKVEWQYKTATNVHSQEFLSQDMADTLVNELKASTIVKWTCLIKPDGETVWY